MLGEGYISICKFLNFIRGATKAFVNGKEIAYVTETTSSRSVYQYHAQRIVTTSGTSYTRWTNLSIKNGVKECIYYISTGIGNDASLSVRIGTFTDEEFIISAFNHMLIKMYFGYVQSGSDCTFSYGLIFFSPYDLREPNYYRTYTCHQFNSLNQVSYIEYKETNSKNGRVFTLDAFTDI